MPMTSIRSQVVQEVQSAMEAIDGTSAYFNNLGNRVHLYNRNMSSINDFPSVIVLEGRERKEIDTVTKFTCFLQVAIVGLIKEGDNIEKSNEISEMLHDIEKALMVDVTLGGTSIDINILGNNYIQNERSDRVGVTVEAEIVFQQSISDPSSST